MEDFLNYEGQCRLVGQGLLEEWVELPDETGEGEEMSDSLIDQSLGDTIVEESPPCPFLLKLVSLLLASSLTCGRIFPYLPSSSLNSSLASILPSSNSELHDESEVISHRILARLLNVCGCVLYLLGNSKAAEEVLRSSIELDGQLEDSRIKLAALLIDMDDTEEVQSPSFNELPIVWYLMAFCSGGCDSSHGFHVGRAVSCRGAVSMGSTVHEPE